MSNQPWYIIIVCQKLLHGNSDGQRDQRIKI